MRIDKINIFKIVLPFKGDFSISLRKGVTSRIIIVEAIGNKNEMSGYGEGIPIETATGETPESTITSIRRFINENRFPWDLDDISQVWNFVDAFPSGKKNNAAICAIELALLDFLGKHQHTAVIDYFPKSYRADKIHYGAPVTLGDMERNIEICKWIKKIGINHIRIKMGKDFEQNKNALEATRRILGSGCELRIDPNGVWNRDLAFKHLPVIETCKVNIVEEPMMRDEPGFPEFVRLLRSKDIILMACESAPTLEDVKRIAAEGYYQMINVKLCRSGGFRRSLAMIDEIRKGGLSFQIGCTLGESGILSAAGRTLCLLCGDALTLPAECATILSRSASASTCSSRVTMPQEVMRASTPGRRSAISSAVQLRPESFITTSA
ncbi:MAG: enolase C-terminal domain-like protein, partial [Candidatus Desulfacyla sp.]